MVEPAGAAGARPCCAPPGVPPGCPSAGKRRFASALQMAVRGHLPQQAGEREAKDTGEEVEECILVQKQRIGRRIVRQVWRDIHQHSTARRRFVGQPPDPTHNGPSRRTQLRRMNEDEAIYQLQKERWDEEEQGETMLTRRANERIVYAREGPPVVHTGRRYDTQSRGESAGSRSRSGLVSLFIMQSSSSRTNTRGHNEAEAADLPIPSSPRRLCSRGLGR